MKKIYLLLYLLFLGFTSNAQKGFDAKQKSKDGNQPQNTLPTIDGQKLQANKKLASDGISIKINQNRIVKNEVGEVIFIENILPDKSQKNAKMGVLAKSFVFLENVKGALQINNPKTEFELVEQQTDELGYEHLRFRQVYEGLPVYGSEVVLHSNGEVIKSLNGKSKKTPSIQDFSSSIEAKKAQSIALESLKKTTITQLDPLTKSILKQQAEEAELVIFYDKQNIAHLTWHMSVKPNILERWTFFIDTKTGEILDKFNNTCSLDGTIKATARDLNGISHTFNVFQSGSQYVMIDAERQMYNRNQSAMPNNPVGTIWTVDAQNTSGEGQSIVQVSSTSSNNWSDKAVSAHINAGLAYDYFRVRHARNSLNGRGGNVISVINIADDDGKGMDNAYWNGTFMGYGNGRTAFRPLAGSLDVAGHEMTHGVVENTAKLEYRNQPGAINESMADVFGILIENDKVTNPASINWTLGETVVLKSAFPSGALRSVSNPNQGGTRDPGYQPKTMGQYVYLRDTPDEDNGGVHVNSGIPNYAFYLFASNPKVGLEAAGKVYYRTLSKYLTRQSQFIDLRLAVVQSAKDLYPSIPDVEAAAKSAFDQVGIRESGTTGGGGGTTPTTPPKDVQVNPGTEFILVYEPSTKQLYTGAASGTDFTPISSKGLLSKPSVTDDGSSSYFVGSDNNIYGISNPTQSSRRESRLTSDGSWRNVAISKDGKRLAATTKAQNKNIYVFNLDEASPKAQPFKLFNPTYSGVQTGEVLYPDSFEWDFAGENLIYDAFNRVRSSTGVDIEYWDVGLIKVWDKAANKYAAGTIEKVFSDLDEGDNIGNPSYSKTSPNVVVFDYFNSDDKADDPYKIIAVDFSKNSDEAIGLLAESNTVGYPNYSKDDKKVTFDTEDSKGLNVSIVNVKANKIEPATAANTFFTDASWLVWFASGQRALPTKTNQTINAFTIANQKKGAKITLSTAASSKLSVFYTIVSGDATIDGNVLTCGNTAGKVRVKAYQPGNDAFNPASPIEVEFSVVDDVAVKQNQTIAFAQIANQLANARIILNVSATSALPVKIEVIKGDATVVDGVLTCGRTLGQVTLRASQAGNNSFNAAASVDVSFNIIAAPTVLSLESIDNDFVIYPNPVQDILEIKVAEGVIVQQLTLVTVDGKVVKRNKNARSMSLKEIPAGKYLIQAETNKGLMNKALVKE